MTLINILASVITIYEFVLFFRFIADILQRNPYRRFGQFFDTMYGIAFNVTEPVLRWLKKIMPTKYKGFDLSLIILVLVCELLKKFVALIFGL